MFKLAKKTLLLSGAIVMTTLPIIAVVSCNKISKNTLEKEAKTLNKNNFYYGGKAFDITEEASFYADSKEISGKLLSEDTKLFVSKIEIDDTKLMITYKIKNEDTFSSEYTFEYKGFKEATSADEYITAAKNLLNTLTDTETTIKDRTALQAIIYDDIGDLISNSILATLTLKQKTILSKVEIEVIATVKDDVSTSQIVIFTITKKGGKTDSSVTLVVSGFKTKAQIMVNKTLAIAKTILDKLKTTTTKNIAQEASMVTSYANLAALIATTNLSGFSISDQLILDKVDIMITALPIPDPEKSTSQLVTFAISFGIKKVQSELIVTGFKTTTSQVAKDFVVTELAKIVAFTIKGDNNKLASTFTTPTSIVALIGFPRLNWGVSFSAIRKTYNDFTGELTIILTASKAGQSVSKELVITGFQTSI